MSIRVMTWAWSVALRPTPKLALMALADIADDHGLCWPSVKALAGKCSLSERSVQRVLQCLHARQLLSIEPQFRKDGSRTSNRYRLAVDALSPDKLSGGGDMRVPGVVTQVSGGGDTDVTPRTTNESVTETPPPCAASEPKAQLASSCGGDHLLIFPNNLSQRQREALGRSVASLAPESAQQILDELAGRMAMATVKNPIRYCAALVERVHRGDFQSELGLRVFELRQGGLARAIATPSIQQTGSLERNRLASKLPKRIREAIERMRSRSNGSWQVVSRTHDDSNPENGGNGTK